MPTKRLSMRGMRGLLRLKHAWGKTERAAALSLGLRRGTVGNYLMRFSQAGLPWPLPPELDDDGLKLLLFPRPTLASRLNQPVPVWAMMDRELRRPRVTRALVWEEYRAQSPDGFDYAWFCEHFDAWKGRMRPTSHQRCAFRASHQRCAFSETRSGLGCIADRSGQGRRRDDPGRSARLTSAVLHPDGKTMTASGGCNLMRCPAPGSAVSLP